MAVLSNNLNSTEHDAINHFKNQLAGHFERRVHLIQLFGSKARGDHTENSDIDILVIIDSLAEQDRDFVYELIMEIVGTYEIYISVTLCSKEEFDHYMEIPTIFIQNVMREGIRLD